jgi:hypothetical protein
VLTELIPASQSKTEGEKTLFLFLTHTHTPGCWKQPCRWLSPLFLFVYYLFILVGLGFELKALCLQGRSFTS